MASLKKDNKKSAANQLTSFINELEAKNSKRNLLHSRQYS
jgi:hypothetical protein